MPLLLALKVPWSSKVGGRSAGRTNLTWPHLPSFDACISVSLSVSCSSMHGDEERWARGGEDLRDLRSSWMHGEEQTTGKTSSKNYLGLDLGTRGGGRRRPSSRRWVARPGLLSVSSVLVFRLEVSSTSAVRQGNVL